MNSLFSLRDSALTELFASLSDRQMICLLVDFYQLAKGIDCLVPGSGRRETTYFPRVMSILPDERIVQP